MLNMNLQIFAHKKGVGSTKNGRDSESKRLGAKRADGQFCLLYTSLGTNLIEISQALLEIKSNDADEVMGRPDNLKLKSSMTLLA